MFPFVEMRELKRLPNQECLSIFTLDQCNTEHFEEPKCIKMYNQD